MILLAVFSGNSLALSGAYVYLIAHGLFSAALFLVLGYVEQREETRLIERLGGLGSRNPRLAGAIVLPVLAALGLPGLAGFSGEILILTGLFKAGFVWSAVVALIPVVLAAAWPTCCASIKGMHVGIRRSLDLPERPRYDAGSEGLALAPLVICVRAPRRSAGVAPGTALQSRLDRPKSLFHGQSRYSALPTSYASPS